MFPETCQLEISKINADGDLMAVADKDDNPQNCKIFVLENRKIKPPLAVGDKIVAKVSKRGKEWIAKPISRLAVADMPVEKCYGIIEQKDGKYYLKSSEKNSRMNLLIDNIGKCKAGDYVAVALTGERRFKQVQILKNYGKFDISKAIESLVLEKLDIPHEFSEKIKKETQRLPQFEAGVRIDLSDVPLVTIDGDDSKDFDDAIWAKKTVNGFNLIVAIADVAFYVRDNSELDREAYKRGNSVYLPNMVIPMLPEVLSNDLCSLNPNQYRASIVCMMEIDKDGNLRDFNFKRAVIKSAARLTYREVQAAIEGRKSERIAKIYKTVIEPVYEAYQALAKASKKRGALKLDRDEYKVKIDKNGQVKSIEKDEHFTSNDIVEEFMVAANVAAALALGKTKLPVMYRVHERPLEEKLKDFAALLHHLGMKLPEGAALKAMHFNKILEKCAKNGDNRGINDMVLRTQSQAKYTPQNIGHFGLALSDYAHFTSPIRRYSDLMIHRALIKAYKMEDGGGLSDEAGQSLFEDIGEHLCVTERRAAVAERETVNRYMSAYLEPSIGQDFEVSVSGLTNAGVFVRLDAIGAEGLMPVSSLPADHYLLSEGNVELKGEYDGLSFKMGDVFKARLVEATPINGGLIFKYVDEETGVDYDEKGRGSFRPHPAKKDMRSLLKKKDKAAKKAKKTKQKRKK